MHLKKYWNESNLTQYILTSILITILEHHKGIVSENPPRTTIPFRHLRFHFRERNGRYFHIKRCKYLTARIAQESATRIFSEYPRKGRLWRTGRSFRIHIQRKDGSFRWSIRESRREFQYGAEYGNYANAQYFDLFCGCVR